MSTAATITAVIDVPQWVKDAARQDGKLAIVTGASAGLGYQTTKFLAERGATVVLACRNEEKTAAVIDRMLAECPAIRRDQLVFKKVDMSVMSSVRSFVDDFNGSGLVKKHGGLHILVNNAGGLYDPVTTAEGHGMTLAANSLGPFLLTNLLLRTALAPPNTPSSTPVRVINVSSQAHRFSRSIDTATLASSDTSLGYPFSKAFNVSFSRHLSNRMRDDGRTNISSFSLNPGIVKTEMGRSAGFLLKLFGSLFSVTADEGAKTQFYLSTDPSIEQYSGEYFNYCAVEAAGGWAADSAHDAPLWELAASWTNL
ncbi:NAD(P)-binding protein [Ramicandelaber brevisporus]|nr:NAD(P)-binding protein [Ramicandelaber brevisporus]